MQRSGPDSSEPPHPLGYWSRTFSALEQRMLATHERELCAVMEGLEYFQVIILGDNLEVWCDHRPLEHLLSQPHLTAKQARWMHRISPFLPFKFEYVSGKSPAMGIADALSRKDADHGKTTLGPLREVLPELARTIVAGEGFPQEGIKEHMVALNHLMAPRQPQPGSRRMNVLILCAGSSRSVERYIRSRNRQAMIVTLDIDPDCCPTICGSVRDWEKLLADAGLADIKWDLIWGCPPCTDFSQAKTRRTRNLRTALAVVQAVLGCIQQLQPRWWVLENPASGPQALHLQTLMKEYEPLRTVTTYCWYNCLYRKMTSFWNNFGAQLREPCKPTDPCPCLQAFGYHPFTAQSGPSKSGALGMGSARAVEGYPEWLLCALLDPLLGTQRPLYTLQPEPASGEEDEDLSGEVLPGDAGPSRSSTPPPTGNEEPGAERESGSQDTRTEGPIPGEEVEGVPDLDTVPLLQEIRRAQQEDPIWRHLQHRRRLTLVVPESEDPESETEEVSTPTEEQTVWETRYELRDGLVRLKEDGRIYIPDKEALKDDIVGIAHGIGHFGENKTYAVVSKYLYWPHMRNEVRRRVAGCKVCGKKKIHRKPHAGTLQPLPVPKEPWTHLSIDFLSGLPQVIRHRVQPTLKHPEGFVWSLSQEPEWAVNSIFVITDRYSKAVRLHACNKNCTGGNVLEWLKQDVFRCFGWPQKIVCDNDIRFGDHFKAYLRERGVDITPTSAFHPPTNGLVERFNSTILNTLRCLCNGLEEQWPSYLPDVEFAINSSPASHRESPYAMFLQFPPRDAMARAIGMGSAGGRGIRGSDAVHELVRARLEEARGQMKKQFDKRHPPLVLRPGDLVYLRRSSLGWGRVLQEDRVGGPGSKLRSPFLGPFRVIRKKRNCQTYVIETDERAKGNAWHVSHLVKAKPAHSLEDQPECNWVPNAVLAARRDLFNNIRYLTRWVGMEGHSWELATDLYQRPEGKKLVWRFRRLTHEVVPASIRGDAYLASQGSAWKTEYVG